MVEVHFFGGSKVCGPPVRTEPDTAASLLEIAGAAGHLLGRSCGARGICRSCSVQVRRGGELLTPAGALELRQRLEPGYRLACQVSIRADAEGSVELAHPAWGE